MINNFTNYFAATFDRDEAAVGIADHVQRFWPIRMQQKLIERARHDDSRCLPLAREAIVRIAGSLERRRQSFQWVERLSVA